MNLRFDGSNMSQSEASQQQNRNQNTNQSKSVIEEDEFWKDCLENSETKTSMNENKEKVKTSENEESYLTCITLLKQLTEESQIERKL